LIEARVGGNVIVMWATHEVAIEAARRTRDQARATRAACVATRGRSVTLCRHWRRIAGSSGDGVSLIAAAIRETSLCWRCIAAKCAMSAQELDETLQRVRRELAIVLSSARCDSCQRDTLLYRLR
jgi:hypothetical protein